ncbi:MAG: hypothetical protein K8W52_29115 [Deltaproteobacteria bacterium]|nr:hypothetical protein [Deltaproteobacteria bacterium]
MSGPRLVRRSLLGAALVALLAAPASAQPVIPHTGTVLEADIGLGVVAVSAGVGVARPAVNVGLGAGWWAGDNTAITLRVTDASFGPALNLLFVGPSIQRWIDERWWLGGGIGATVVLGDGVFQAGFGVDLRVGRALSDTVNVSLEITPGTFSMRDDGGVFYGQRGVGAGVLIGYQAP